MIIDEKKGRNIALEKGIKITGLIGVLILFKNKGLLKTIKPVLDVLVNKIGFRLSPELISRVLIIVGET